jgi:hypothetical protein
VENDLVLTAYVLSLALLLLGNTGAAATVFVGASVIWTGLQILKRREARRRASERDAVMTERRRENTMPMLLIWQCSEQPGHRGWRYPMEPAGSCDYCQAMTEFEHEVVTAGRTYTPAHPEGLQ